MYLYETHLHTSPVSPCAVATPAEQVEVYKGMGYDAVCVTNHILHGGVHLTMPWGEYVDYYYSGYEQAKAAGDKVGLKVFFGIEYTAKGLGGLDILVYGLDKDWLKAHPEILDIDVNSFCDLARESGGILIHAHPFREENYISMIRLLPRKVDGVEVLNASRPDSENFPAGKYAEQYGLSVSAGSDNHAGRVGRYAGVSSETPFNNAYEMAKAIVEGKIEIFERQG